MRDATLLFPVLLDYAIGITKNPVIVVVLERLFGEERAKVHIHANAGPHRRGMKELMFVCLRWKTFIEPALARLRPAAPMNNRRPVKLPIIENRPTKLAMRHEESFSVPLILLRSWTKWTLWTRWTLWTAGRKIKLIDSQGLSIQSQCVAGCRAKPAANLPRFHSSFTIRRLAYIAKGYSEMG